MKKLISIFLMALAASLGLSAKTLVAYYSYTNNVSRIVGELAKQIKADVVRIEPAEKGLDYAANNYAIGSAQIAAIRNRPDDAASYPAIDPVGVNLDDYDTVIIGAPPWWSQMAAPMQTYLFHNGARMAGKNIGLIVSSASSGISGVEADARRLVPAGKFLSKSLWVRSSQTSDASAMVAEWLKAVGYNQLASIIDINADEAPAATRIFSLAGTEYAADADLPSGIYIVEMVRDNSRKAIKIKR